jgi:hypothetical protein
VEELRFSLSKLTARRNMQTVESSDVENEKAVFELKGTLLQQDESDRFRAPALSTQVQALFRNDKTKIK